jgi:hypothetical protein
MRDVRRCAGRTPMRSIRMRERAYTFSAQIGVYRKSIYKQAQCGFVHMSSLLPTLIPLSGVGTTCFSSCCDKDSAIFLRPAACLKSTFLETGVGVNDCKCNQDQRLIVPSEARRSSR